jgi:hypothetical protein
MADFRKKSSSSVFCGAGDRQMTKRDTKEGASSQAFIIFLKEICRKEAKAGNIKAVKIYDKTMLCISMG